MRYAIAVLAALVLGVFAVGVGANTSVAQAESGQRDVKVAQTTDRTRDFHRAIALMEQHMRVTEDGTLALDEEALSRDIEAGKARGIRPGTFAGLKEALKATNTRLRSGALKASDVFPSGGARPFAHSTAVQGDGTVTASGCRGKSGSRFYWWGVRIWLNSCQTNNLIFLLQSGAGGLTICKKIGPIPCRVAAVIAQISVARIVQINNNGGNDGLVIDKSWGLKLPRIYSQR
jgi:hypothetical protein